MSFLWITARGSLHLLQLFVLRKIWMIELRKHVQNEDLMIDWFTYCRLWMNFLGGVVPSCLILVGFFSSWWGIFSWSFLVGWNLLLPVWLVSSRESLSWCLFRRTRLVFSREILIDSRGLLARSCLTREWALGPWLCGFFVSWPRSWSWFFGSVTPWENS